MSGIFDLQAQAAILKRQNLLTFHAMLESHWYFAMQQKHDVFISHSSADKKIADVIWKALQQRNYSCWIAPHSIRPSEEYPDAIRRGVREAKAVVLLFSANSDDSGEVATELRFAKRFSIPIIWLRLEAIEPEKLDYYIGSLQWINAVEPLLSDQLEGVIDEIERALPEKSENQGSIPGDSAHDIFISYSNLNRGFADDYYKFLKSNGLRVWMDQDGVPGGPESQAALRSSRAMFLVVSGPSIRAANVKQEIEWALELGLPILPVQIQDLNPNAVYAEQLKKLDWIDAKGSQTQSKLDEIMAAAQKVLSAQEPPLAEATAGAKTSGTASVAAGAVTIQSVLTSRGHRNKRLFDAIRAGATDVKATDRAGLTALHYAAREGEFELVPLLLERGADINAQDGNGHTPLFFTLKAEYLTRLLLLNGADFEVKDNAGNTALHYAYENKITSAKNLLELFADIKRGDKTPNQALRAALDLRSHKSARIMDAIAAGADDLTMRDTAGRNALHWAAQDNEPYLVELLLGQGADADVVDHLGNTPLMLARHNGCLEVEAILRDFRPASASARPGLASTAPMQAGTTPRATYKRGR